MSYDKPDHFCRYFLGQDNSSHWYLVLEDSRLHWEAWRNLPEEDERSWNEPWYASRLNGGPGSVTFIDPVNIND